ncbi:MAG TPA: MBL fold metallo-hydrolase [bacterium]|nr:MBL fold metallo-hydrolase [bacterium]
MAEKCIGPVRFIPGENRGRYPYCNSVYIEGARILIDPASDRGRLMELRDGPGVKEVWLSHWHEDHFMHLDLFEGVPFAMPALETAPLTDPEIFMDWYGIDDPGFRNFWRQALKDTFHFRPRTPSRTFKGGEEIALPGVTVDVIHVPGHTPGHLAFLFREPGVLFMADYDLTKFGPWYGDRDSSIEDTIASVNRLRRVPARAWLTGHEHGLFESEPGELWDRYLAVIDEREEKLLAYLSEPRTIVEIVNQWIVYKKPREPKGFFEYGERALMAKHLERLIRAGSVMEEDGEYRATP